MGRPPKATIDPRAVAALAKARDAQVRRAARHLLTELRHTAIRGHYLIPPSAVLALCQAVDEADGIAERSE